MSSTKYWWRPLPLKKPCPCQARRLREERVVTVYHVYTFQTEDAVWSEDLEFAETVYERAQRFFTPDEIAEAFAATRGLTLTSQLRSQLRQDGRRAPHPKRMTPERFQQVDRILQAALERAPGERRAYLAAECGEDEELRGEVESLLGRPR